MNFITYLKKYRVTTCQKCMHVILSSQIMTHFQSSKHRWTVQRARDLITIINEASLNLIQYFMKFEMSEYVDSAMSKLKIWYVSWSQTIVDTYVATSSSCKFIASRSMTESNRRSESAQARVVKSDSEEVMHSSHEKSSYVSDFSFRDMNRSMLKWEKKSMLRMLTRMIKCQHEIWSEKRWIRSSTRLKRRSNEWFRKMKSTRLIHGWRESNDIHIWWGWIEKN